MSISSRTMNHADRGCWHPRVIRSFFSIGIVAALATASLPAEDAPKPDPAAHTVIVPYDARKPVNGAKAERYYLDYAEFQRLWALAKENRRPESADKEEGKPETAITSALYDTEIQEDRFVIHARLSVVTRGGSWVKLPLAFKAEGLSISDVKLDGSIAVLNNGELVIEHTGAHQVELTAQVLMARGWKDLKLELPRAVAALMAVTASERDGRPQFSSKQWLVVDEQRQGKRTFTLPLGSESTFGLTRQPYRKEVADAPPASVSATSTVTVLPLMEKIDSQIVFGFAGTERRTFSVRFDGSLKPVQWGVEGLRDLTLRKDGNDVIADLVLLVPVADEFKMSLSMERMTDAAAASQSVSEVNGVAVKKTSTVNLLSSDALQLKPVVSASVQRTASHFVVKPGFMEAGSFRLLEGGKLTYDVLAAEDRSAVKLDQVYQLSAQKAEVIAVADLNTGRVPLHQARIGVPQGFEVQTITGPRVRGWHREGSEVRVDLGSELSPEAKLVVHVAKTLTAPVTTWKLEPLTFAEFKKHEANVLVAVHAADDVKLEFDATKREVREVDPASLQTPLSVALPLAVKRALVVTSPAWNATVTLTRQTPKFAVDAVLLAQATDAGLKLSQQTDVIIEQGMVNSVKVRLPKELPEAHVLGTQVRDARSSIEGNMRVYEVTFQSDVLERTDFSMEMELPIDGAKTLPVLAADGASRIRRFFIVDNQSSREMTATPGKAEAVVKETLPYLPEGLSRPQYYRAAEGAELKVAFSQLESTAGNAAIVTLAEITSALRINGERWDTVVYSLANRSLQFLPVKPPVGAELIEVSVGDQQVRTDVEGRGEKRIHLVPLIQMRPGELSQQVKLVYKLKADRDTTRLDDPELVGLSAERTLWNVWVPPTHEVSRWDGNMEEVNEELRDYEKKREMLSDLARMNRVMASSDVKSSDWKMARDNAGALMNKLRSFKPAPSRSYEAAESKGLRRQETTKLRETVQKVQSEVEGEIHQQGALLDKNMEVQRQSQGVVSQSALPGKPDAKMKQQWAIQSTGQGVQTNANGRYLEKKEAAALSGNKLAFNDNVGITKDALAQKDAAKADASKANLGNGQAVGTGGLVLNSNNARGNAAANTYTGGTTITAGQLVVNAGSTVLAGNISVPKAASVQEPSASTYALTTNSLQKASSFESVGDYDKALKEYQNVLRVDQYNPAARRGLERLNRSKNEYTASAGDHQRARMLKKANEGWEEKLPAAGKPQAPVVGALFKSVDEIGAGASAVTPQLKPVGRVSLPVNVPLEGTVYHFRKLKDHAKVELVVSKPLEMRQASAMWALVVGAVIVGGWELYSRRRRQRAA